MNILDRARRYIRKMDPAISGSGGHDKTFAVASVLIHGFALESETALALLHEWNQSHCEPPWSDSQLRHKIESALATPPGKPHGYLLESGHQENQTGSAHHVASAAVNSPTWPAANHGKILHLLGSAFFSITDLEAASPIPPDGLTDPYAIIDSLFVSAGVPDPLLCLARDIKKPATRPRSQFQGHLERAQFIVPNPMNGPKGKTQDGRDSVRCLANTGPRRFLVIECDFTPEKDKPLFDWLDAHKATVPDLCATVLCYLAEFAPLVMAVHSGGKSLHGWFAVQDRSETDLKEFMRFACSYGADKATFTRCQFVRMPNGTRDNGAAQTVHYFDNDPTLLSQQSNPVESTA